MVLATLDFAGFDAHQRNDALRFWCENDLLLKLHEIVNILHHGRLILLFCAIVCIHHDVFIVIKIIMVLLQIIVDVELIELFIFEVLRVVVTYSEFTVFGIAPRINHGIRLQSNILDTHSFYLMIIGTITLEQVLQN